MLYIHAEIIENIFFINLLVFTFMLIDKSNGMNSNVLRKKALYLKKYQFIKNKTNNSRQYSLKLVLVFFFQI